MGICHSAKKDKINDDSEVIIKELSIEQQMIKEFDLWRLRKQKDNYQRGTTQMFQSTSKANPYSFIVEQIVSKLAVFQLTEDEMKDVPRGGKLDTPIKYYPSGETYFGEMLHRKPHGLGEMIQSNGACFIGLWEQGLRSGRGREIYVNGGVLEAYFSNNEIRSPKYYTQTNCKIPFSCTFKPPIAILQSLITSDNVTVPFPEIVEELKVPIIS